MTLDLGMGLQEAAQRIHPRHPDYADLPIDQGFDWSAIAACPFEKLYLVVFRSIRRPDADMDLLRWYDDLAYAEALNSGGLLRYLKGAADERGHCLSFCLWESREAAVRASGSKQHARAATITSRMYVSYELERYELTPGNGGGRPNFRRL